MTAQQTLNGILNIEDFNGVTVTLALASFDSETENFIFRSLNISQNLANEFCNLPIGFLSTYFNLSENGDLLLHEFTGGYKPDHHEIEWLDYNNNEILEALCEVPAPGEIPLVDLNDNSFCVFHAKSASDSTRSRPLIPFEVGHRFQRNPATLSDL